MITWAVNFDVDNLKIDIRLSPCCWRNKTIQSMDIVWSFRR